MDKLLEKNPTEVIRRAVVGMLPNNNIRDRIVDRFLIVHEGMYHNHTSQKLPQFVKLKPEDINERYELGKDKLNKEDYKITFESNPSATP